MDVTIDGMRYVPDPNVPTKILIYYMNDNHTFVQIYGATVDAIIDRACEIESVSPYGMLCPFELVNYQGIHVGKGKEIAHSYNPHDSKDKWYAGLSKWRQEIESNADAMRLIALNVKPAPSQDI